MFYLDAQAKFSESKDVSKEELQDDNIIEVFGDGSLVHPEKKGKLSHHQHYHQHY